MYYTPTIKDKDYKKGMYVTCPLRWQRAALECLHEGAEVYMVSLLKDTNLLGYTCQANHPTAKGHTIGTKDKGGTKLV